MVSIGTPDRIVGHFAALAAILVVLTACATGPRPTSVSVQVSEDSAYITESLTASATVQPAGASQDVVWSSSDESVAVVAADGTVTGGDVGTAVITATSAANAGVSGSVTIEVLSPLAGRTILYYVDDINGTDVVKVALEQAVSEQGATRIEAGFADFLDHMDDGPFLIVYTILDEGSLSAGHRDALLEWVEHGERLMFTHWNIDDLDAIDVWAGLGAEPDGSENHRGELTVTETQLRVGLTSATVGLIDDGWHTDNIGLEVLETGTALAEYEDGTAAIVGGNSGRTAVVGFLNDTIDEADGARLFLNVFYRLALAEDLGPL